MMKITKRVYELDDISRMIAPVISKYDVSKLYVFGSYSRNEATYKSDIDFYVEGYNYHRFLSLGSMYEDFEESLHKHVDIITDKDLMLNKSDDANRLFESITKERVLVYERKENRND